MVKNNKKLTIQEFSTRGGVRHNFKYDYSKTIYNNAITKIEIICPHHGSFFQIPKSHLNGYGCPKCGIEKLIQCKPKTREQFIEDAEKIHGNLYNYSKINYVDAHTKIKIICKMHGSFFQIPNNHLNGRGCDKCGGSANSNRTEFMEKSIKVHGNLYNYSKINYKNRYTKICIICSKHGEFFQTPGNHLNGRGCPKCTHIISKPESEFLDYLKIPDIKENRQVHIKPYKVDGIKNNKIFEFLGDYFHGNPEKYKSSDYNQICHKTFGELYENLKKKFNILNDMGYSIYYIWEKDWNFWNKNRKNYSFPLKKFDNKKYE